MSLSHHLNETDERIPASVLYTEWYYDSDVDPGDAQDAMDDAAWRESQEMFDRHAEAESNEDPAYDDEGPDMEDPRYADTWD